jgi:hypothetical protein
VTPRPPRWFIEVVAWTAALVLVGGVVVAVSGVIGKTTTTTTQALGSDDEVPVVQPAVPAPAPARTKVPVKVPVLPPSTPQKQVTQRATRTAVSIESILGPPPGPQTDRVPTSFAAPADRYAFLIGVSDYPAPTHPTIGGANDVRFIYSSLLAAGWLRQNIKIYTDRQVTGAVTREGLRWLAGKSTPGTFTLFHYSGHVKQEGGHEKLWPADRDFVLDTEVASILGTGTGRMWVDIAGCEAAGFIESLPSGHRLVTTSSLASQKSYEYPQWGESVWTGLVFDLGLAQHQADANKDGVTTVGEALRYAQYYAQAITLHQTPHGRQTPQIEGDDVLGWTLANPPA